MIEIMFLSVWGRTCLPIKIVVRQTFVAADQLTIVIAALTIKYHKLHQQIHPSVFLVIVLEPATIAKQ